MKHVKIMMTTKPSPSTWAVAAGSPIIKTTALFLLFACLPCCFGQTDTNLLATGDWSETVRDNGGDALRGRLLVYDDFASNALNHARVYLELQHVHVSESAWDSPTEVYFEFGARNDLNFEMHDKLDKSIPRVGVVEWGPVPDPYWVSLPYESTVRVRADTLLGPESKPAGLEILVPGGCWDIPPNATNDFFLSATLTPPKDHPSALNYHVWQGTLKLPSVKIPAKNP